MEELKGIGNPVIYVGSKTGRDGLGGAVMSSASFMKIVKAKDQLFKLEIHLLKNYF